MEEILEEFEKRKNSLIRYKATLEKNLKKAIDKYNRIKTSEIDKKEARLKIAQNTISSKKNALAQIEDQLEFLRPSDEKDMEYRLRQYNEFSKKMKDLVPEDLPLRFHGCPIYTAKHILESGEISSSVDRLGVETSYDTEGQISVTTKDTLDTTIQGYTHLSENFLPAGCVFVLLPKDELDAKAGDSMLMGNVNFKQEPNRLYGIITTPENIERVSQWAKVSGVDLSKIHDFDEFAKLFEKQKIVSKGESFSAHSKPIVDTQRLGKETLDMQKNTRKLDKVEQQINTQINEDSKKKDSHKVEKGDDDYVM